MEVDVYGHCGYSIDRGIGGTVAMCYAKPGPRCSAHAKQYLDKAKAVLLADPKEENKEAFLVAHEEYRMSPAGIKELRSSGLDAEADRYQQKRKERIALYKASVEGGDDEDGSKSDPEPFNREYNVPLENFEAAQHQIDIANRRLVRNGIAERFEMMNVSRHTETRGTPPNLESREMVKFTLNRPKLKIGGWQVAGRVDSLSDGSLIAMTAPDTELNGFAPESQICEHCGQQRHRNNTYLLKGEDGSIKQVGSNCLQSFTGIRPQGLWALEYDLEERTDRDRDSSNVGWTRAYTPENVVALTLLMTEDGRNYRSTSRAREYGTQSTSSMVNTYLNPSTQLANSSEYRALLEQASSDEVRARAQEVIEFASSIEGHTDYATNLRNLVRQEGITSRHIGIVASAVSAWHREQTRNAQRTAVPERNEWVGTVGEKIENEEVTIIGIHGMESQYGHTTLVSMRDSQGRTLKWFASGYKDFETGQTMKLEKATVKKHDEYNGNKQTVLTRPTILPAGLNNTYIARPDTVLDDFRSKITKVDYTPDGSALLLDIEDSENRAVKVIVRNAPVRYEAGQSFTFKSPVVLSNTREEGIKTTYLEVSPEGVVQ